MRKLTVAAIAVAMTVPVFATADAVSDAVKARQEHMKGYGKSIGMLAKMAKGEVDYDAAEAQAAADKIAELAAVDITPWFVPGSSSDDLPGESRALPALWTEKGKEAGVIHGDLQKASMELQAVAGQGKAEMAGGLGAVGKTCQSCHDSFQQPRQ